MSQSLTWEVDVTPLKRKNPSTSSTSTDCSPAITPSVPEHSHKKKEKPEKKKQKKGKTDFRSPNPEDENMADKALQDSLCGINKKLDKLDNLPTREDYNLFKNEINKLIESLNTKIDKLEGRVYEVEKENDGLQNALAAAKEKNELLNGELKKQKTSLQNSEKALNDLEQYGRRWSVRVFGVQEPNGPSERETIQECTEKAVNVFRDMIGIKQIGADDIEMCHRTGSFENARANKKSRPIIVRFFSRQKRELVLKDRKNLKGKRVSVGEDLTIKNVKLL